MSFTKHNNEIYSEIFDKKSDSHHKLFLFKKNICHSLINKKHKKILDVGCGDGFMIEGLDKKLGSKLFGLDISKKALLKASKKNIKTKKADIEGKKWPYKKDSFDLVIACDIIEHLYDTELFVKEAYRVLKKGGELIISIPNINAYYNRLFTLIGMAPIWIESAPKMVFWPKIGNDFGYNTGHIRVFNKHVITKLLRAYKFQIETIKGVPFNIEKEKFEGVTKPLGYLIQGTEFLFSMFNSFSSLIIIKAIK